MPSFRVQVEILGLRAGHPPEAVLDAAVDSLGQEFHVDDRQVDVVAGTPRITVRFTVPDSSDDEEAERARAATDDAVTAVARVARVGRHWVLRRLGGRWLPLG